MQKAFSNRRKRLMQAMKKNSIAVVFSASEQPRNGDVHYPFRQNSDFYYLTGLEEPNAAAVFFSDDESFLLFCEENDPHTALWTGKKAGTEGATLQYGADEAFSIDELDERMPEFLAGKHSIYFSMGHDCGQDNQLSQWLQDVNALARKGIQAPSTVRRLQSIVHELRLIKSSAEIQMMREAASISAQAHCQAMKTCRPDLNEYHLEAALKHTFMQAGCRQEAYPAIVGGGENACVLHYTDNHSALNDGDLVLIDAGAERKNYAADITRTFPVNGVFSSAQKALYQWVLKAQLQAIEQVKPGASFNDPHTAAVQVLTQGLVELGLLSGQRDALIESGAYKKFYMHRTGHWLGLDVHDVGAYKINEQWRTLVPGMVLTIEPGLYIPSGSEGVDERWWGIGIRIEDDVLVTDDGCEVLSHEAPKTVEAIEQWMRH